MSRLSEVSPERVEAIGRICESFHWFYDRVEAGEIAGLEYGRVRRRLYDNAYRILPDLMPEEIQGIEDLVHWERYEQ